MLNEKEGTSGSKILTTNSETEKTLENASSVYKLSNGVLAGKESKTFEFRAIESVMEKTLNSKITVVTSFKAPVNTTNMMIPMEVQDDTNYTYTQDTKYSSTLKKVIFESEKNPIEGVVEIKDFSVNQDESVLGYYVGNMDQTEVELHIQADEKIKVNTNGAWYFTSSLYETLSHLGCPKYTFEGFENLDTSEVTDMSFMFVGMCATNLDLNNFDTSNVKDMRLMFYGMGNLTELNISGFDTSNVNTMSMMFYNNSNLTNIIYGDHFIRKPNSQIDSMFQNCPANKPTHSSWNGVTW